MRSNHGEDMNHWCGRFEAIMGNKLINHGEEMKQLWEIQYKAVMRKA
jgi:hypothetical protein